MSNQLLSLWPIAAFFIILSLLLAVMLGLSHVLGTRNRNQNTNTPYESGIVAPDAGESRFASHFFLYGVLFVIFDLETIFLFAWVIAFDEVGWPGFIEASIFIFILLAALVYVWRVGALSLTRRHLPERRES